MSDTLPSSQPSPELTDTDTEMQNIPSDSASANWTWTDWARRRWEEAAPEWQRFAKKWRNVEDEALRPQSRALDLVPDRPPGVDTTSLYIRKSYEEGVELVRDRAKNISDKGVIFTGQPGTGKTVFLWYLLVSLLQAKEVVLFHAPGENSLLFYDDKVYSAPRNASSAALPTPKPSPSSTSRLVIWSLFDLGPDELHPILATSPPQCFVVQAPSPNEKWYKHWRKERDPTFTGFPTWTPEEIAACATLDSRVLEFKEHLKVVVEHWPDIPQSEAFLYPGVLEFLKATHGEDALGSAEQAFNILLDALIEQFGPFPRDIFFAMFGFTKQAAHHEEALTMGFAQFCDLARQLKAGVQFPHTTIPNRTIALHSNGVGVATRWKLAFKSVVIGSLVLDRTQQESEDKVRELISLLSRVPAAKALAGHLFEPYVHRGISNGIAGAESDKWSLRPMTLKTFVHNSPTFLPADSHAIVPGFSNSNRTHVVFDPDDLPDELLNDHYYQAALATLPFFDAFVVNIDFSEWSADLWILQMTTSTRHRGSSKGYAVIHKIMQKIKSLFSHVPPPAKRTKLTDGKPQVVNPPVVVHYVLVRPDGKGRSTWKLPEGWDEHRTDNDHQGHGYILDISLTPKLSELYAEVVQYQSEDS